MTHDTLHITHYTLHKQYTVHITHYTLHITHYTLHYITSLGAADAYEYEDECAGGWYDNDGYDARGRRARDDDDDCYGDGDDGATPPLLAPGYWRRSYGAM